MYIFSVFSTEITKITTKSCPFVISSFNGLKYHLLLLFHTSIVSFYPPLTKTLLTNRLSYNKTRKENALNQSIILNFYVHIYSNPFQIGFFSFFLFPGETSHCDVMSSRCIVSHYIVGAHIITESNCRDSLALNV